MDSLMLDLVTKEYNYAKSICNDFDRKGMEDSAEAWGLVVARLGRVLEDYESKVCVGGVK
jgi:hypothetical protein